MKELIFQVKHPKLGWIGIQTTLRDEVRVIENNNGHIIIRYSNEKADPNWENTWNIIGENFDKIRKEGKNKKNIENKQVRKMLS